MSEEEEALVPDGGKPSKNWSSEFQFGEVFSGFGFECKIPLFQYKVKNPLVFFPYSVHFWFVLFFRKETWVQRLNGLQRCSTKSLLWLTL